MFVHPNPDVQFLLEFFLRYKLSKAIQEMAKTVNFNTIPRVKTSRERPKSAPYLRLKISKRTSKCQEFFSTVPA